MIFRDQFPATAVAALGALQLNTVLGHASDPSQRLELACHSACNFDPLSRGIGVQN
jgi:hypothetical protein